MTKGDLYYLRGYKQKNYFGKGKPVVVVSGKAMNEKLDGVVVVPLSIDPAAGLAPQHVRLDSAKNRPFAIVDRLNTVTKDRLYNYAGRVSPSEVADMDEAISALFGLS